MKILILLSVLAAFSWSTAVQAGQKPVKAANFSREEFMIINLNRGTDSAGFHISNSLKGTRSMVRDLDKGLRQMEQVDKAYAKSKGRPDDRFLQNSSERLKKALETAQKLEIELEEAREELKSSIQQSLIMGDKKL